MAGMEKKSADTNNRRRHIRYRDPERRPIRFSYMSAEDGKVYIFDALLVDESHGGMCCVALNHESVPKGMELYWIEGQNVPKTPCEVVHCREIDPGVYRFSVQLKG